jgi:hypothetical protein
MGRGGPIRGALVATALSSLVAGTAHATWDVWNGNALSEMCQNWPHGGKADWQDVFKTGSCIGYVWGVAGALFVVLLVQMVDLRRSLLSFFGFAALAQAS